MISCRGESSGRSKLRLTVSNKLPEDGTPYDILYLLGWFGAHPCIRVERRRSMGDMGDTNVTLAIMAAGWHAYQAQLSEALAPLTPEQLALRATPQLRSIEELV